MRSELVFGATAQISNRYLLTRAAAEATRMLHRPNVRLGDTSNDVFRLFCQATTIFREFDLWLQFHRMPRQHPEGPVGHTGMHKRQDSQTSMSGDSRVRAAKVREE
jgi:hypothetical protein